ESEADGLGVTYLKRAGYDPRAMATVLQSLAAQTNLDAQILGTSDRVPEWASTHPDPASRVRSALALAGPQATGKTNRDLFLT
ncbi:M48 family metalloprotease, partial [Acinetobacter baumannii]